MRIKGVMRNSVSGLSQDSSPFALKNMYGYEHEEGNEGCGCGYQHEHMWHHFKHKKEFKLAILEKKEKMLTAKLEFIRRMKEIVEKSKDEEEKME